MSQPQYIGEVAPTHLRGRLVGLYGACFQFGSVFVSTIKRPQNSIANEIKDVSRLDWIGHDDKQLGLENTLVRE